MRYSCRGVLEGVEVWQEVAGILSRYNGVSVFKSILSETQGKNRKTEIKQMKYKKVQGVLLITNSWHAETLQKTINCDRIVTGKIIFNVNTGQGFGSEAGLPFLKEHIDVYKEWQFINPDGSYNQIGCPKVATDLFRTKGITLDGTEQTVCDVHIYPAEYFNPYDSITGKLTKTKNTYSIHWYDASWSGQSDRSRSCWRSS